MAPGNGFLPRETVTYEQAEAASIAPQATSTGFDDFFAYNLTDPVTVRQNESALVPILQAKVPTDRVTIVTSDGNSIRQPLRALWVTNTSDLTLDGGSFTVIENGNFGGRGLFEPIHAGEKRLLSYASDQAVHVVIESNRSTQQIVRITAAKGILKLQHADVRETTYILHNSAAESRNIVLEHPIFSGYELDSVPAATDTTSTVYRFREVVAAGKTEHLHVSEEHRGTTIYELNSSDDSQMELILGQSGHNAKLEAVLQPVFEACRRVADAQVAVDRAKDRLTALRADETRQRANITALGNTDRRARDRFVSDLNQTEDAVKAAQAELTTRTASLESARTDLATHIEALQIDARV